MNFYNFIDGEFEYKYEIKHSLFIASIKGDIDEISANEFIKTIKKRYSDATHNCYAYIADEKSIVSRFSDDGEPGGTAGQPILEVIKKNNLVKTCIVVTRYFGGIKLGANGLLSAYTYAAANAINIAKVNKRIECKMANAIFDYSSYSIFVKYISSTPCRIDTVEYGDDVKVNIIVPLDYCLYFNEKIRELFCGRIAINYKEDTFFSNIKN